MIDEKRYTQIKNWTRNYIDEKCIYRGPPIPGKKPGTTYTWQFYLRNGLFNIDFLSAISQMFVYQIKKEVKNFNFQLAGLETASTPMLAGIPLISATMGYEINAFSIRKERKKYGLLNWIEGIPNEKPVMLIDDLCNSQESMSIAHNVVKEHNLKIFDYAFCIVNKTNKTSKEKIKADKYLPKNIKIIYLFDLDDFNLVD